MLNFSLSTLDIVIMVVYAVAMIWYGLSKAKRSSSEDYFLAGRNMTWPIVGISLFAANISSTTLVGLAGDAYSTGISVYNYEWFAVVILIFFSIFFLPFYLKSKVYTMPEFLERRFDARSRYYFAFTTLIGNVLVETAAPLYIGALIFENVFPDVDSWIIILLLALAAAAYTIPGGLSSVVHTEVIQALLLIAGSIVLTIFALDAAGGWNSVLQAMSDKFQAGILPNNPDEMLSLIRPIDDPGVPWLGLITGVPILGFYFWANNQFMVQRTLSARDLNHGRWGSLFAGLLKVPVIFIMVLPGTMALAFGPEILGEGITHIDNPDLVYPALVFKLLPVGLVGLVLAGLLAAMSSSISATLNSASTLITMDFVRKISPGLTSQQLVRVGQIATVVLVVLAAMWAPQIKNFDSLFKYLQIILSYIAPPVVAAFLMGLFWKRANGHGAFWSFMFAAVLSIIMVFAGGPKVAQFMGDIGFGNLISYKSTTLAGRSIQLDRENGYAYTVEAADEGEQIETLRIEGGVSAQAENGIVVLPERAQVIDGTITNAGIDVPIGMEKLVVMGGEVRADGDDLLVSGGVVARLFPDFHFLYVATLLLVLCVIVIVLVSLLTAPPAPEKIESMTWRNEIYTSETAELRALPWYKNYRTLALILLAVTAVVVVWFW